MDGTILDPTFEVVDLTITRGRKFAKRGVPLFQGLEGVAEQSFGMTSHLGDHAIQFGEFGVVGANDVLAHEKLLMPGWCQPKRPVM
jgi:hypothetical protein